MIRNFIIGVTVLFCGAILFKFEQTVNKVNELEEELGKRDAITNSLRAELEQASLRTKYLDKDNARLTKLVEQLNKDMFDKSMDTLSTDTVDLPIFDDEPSENASIDTSEIERDQENRENRRREFSAEMESRQSQWMDYMDERWENADLETKKRITALVEHQNSMLDIRDLMRNAESDEERAELRGDMQETFQNMRQISSEQQKSMLTSVATTYGIQSSEDQEAFTQAVNDVISDPLFQLRPPGRGSPGGGGGGFGGGRRGQN